MPRVDDLSVDQFHTLVFRQAGVPLLKGRNFDAGDRPDSPLVIIANETMARHWWPGENPIGKTLWLGCHGNRERAHVIGVARDSKYVSLDEPPTDFYYTSSDQAWWMGYFALIVKTACDPYGVAAPLLQLARASDPKMRIFKTSSVEDEVARSLWAVRWQAALLGAFSLLAVSLAVVGLYSVVAYTVARRTREIGVRMALGANRSDVLWVVLRRGLRLTAVGVAAGLALSVALTRLLRGFLYGVSPLDPAAFASAALLWFVIAMLACSLPARCATRVDPQTALRYE